jgi:hypothetical protein
MDGSSLLVIFKFLIALGFFVLLVYIGKRIVNNDKLMEDFKNSRFFNPLEYLPSEEIYTLKQVFFLIMILVFIVIILYIIFGWEDGLYFISMLDIIISLYLAITEGSALLKEKILLFLLIPFGSIYVILFGNACGLHDLLHILAYLYFIQLYYRKFVQYTENNGLGITITLLFSIILVSFLFTILVENVSPMDSITMVSNAFTSNSFEASGKTMVGKFDSLFLAWGGFILSGVGTATLAVSMIKGRVDRQFDDIENLIKNKKKKN